MRKLSSKAHTVSEVSINVNVTFTIKIGKAWTFAGRIMLTTRCPNHTKHFIARNDQTRKYSRNPGNETNRPEIEQNCQNYVNTITIQNYDELERTKISEIMFSEEIIPKALT